MATELIKENSYDTAFQELTESHRDEPQWLRDLRERSFAQFQSAGFPSVQNEEWKYTNVASIARAKFSPVIAANGTGFSKTSVPFTYEETRGSVFVFVNGIFRDDLSSLESLPAGVIATGLGAAVRDKQHESLIRPCL